MRSLLEILEEEKREVKNIRFYEDSISDFIDLENKDEGCLEVYKGAISIYKEKIKESENRLIDIRKELKKYLASIMEL